jgi:WD40 repeat protein
MVSGGGDSVMLWETENGTLIRDFYTPRSTCVAFSPDGKLIASDTESGKVMVWDSVTGKLLRTIRGHKTSLGSLAFSPNGKMIATTTAEDNKDQICLWDLESGRLVRRLDGDIVRASVRMESCSP